MIIFSILGLIVLKVLIYDPLSSFWQSNPSPMKIFITVLQNGVFQGLMLVLILITSGFLFVRYKIKAYRRNQEILVEQERLEQKTKWIESWLSQEVEYLNSGYLKEFIKKMEMFCMPEELEDRYEVKIRNKLILANNYLERRLHEEEERRYDYRIEKLSNEVWDLTEKRFKEEQKSKDKDKLILERLNAEDTFIYESKKLRPEEIEVLKKEGFKEINEYDLIYKENTNFLVKQILNHSPTHTFLVARIANLLNQYENVREVYLHETRDADITFEVGKTIYALEVEAGSLLYKKNQLREKVSYLNNKYGKNWYFVVTNRNLAKKYRKFGRVTSRMGVSKIIEKIAKN